MVGHIGQAPNPGDYFTGSMAGVNYVVVRGNDGVLRAFHNVCRHKAAPIAEGSGCTQMFECMYHGWQFGKSRSIPQGVGFLHEPVPLQCCCLHVEGMYHKCQLDKYAGVLCRCDGVAVHVPQVAIWWGTTWHAPLHQCIGHLWSMQHGLYDSLAPQGMFAAMGMGAANSPAPSG